jgi:transcriptional regulator with XRE-family HTH domain
MKPTGYPYGSGRSGSTAQAKTGTAGTSSLPTRLRHVRETLGLTRAGFARRLRVTRNSVSRYELGHQVPTAAVLVRVAGVGGVSLDWLLAGEDPATPRRARPAEWAATVAALRRVWKDPSQRAAVQAALEAWARGSGTPNKRVHGAAGAS